MASGPITSLQISGGTVETVADFILGGLQNHWRSWLQPWNWKHLLPGTNVMTNLDSILKSRDITLPAKVCLVNAMVFPVVMYGCESWTIKKAECWKIDAFELWYWRILLRVSWTARRSNQSILKEISPEYSLEGVMLKLKLQYFATDLKNWLTRKDFNARKYWQWNRRRWQRMRLLDDITDSVVLSLSRLWEFLMAREIGVLQSMGSQRVGHYWVTEVKLNWIYKFKVYSIMIWLTYVIQILS